MWHMGALEPQNKINKKQSWYWQRKSGTELSVCLVGGVAFIILLSETYDIMGYTRKEKYIFSVLLKDTYFKQNLLIFLIYTNSMQKSGRRGIGGEKEVHKKYVYDKNQTKIIMHIGMYECIC